MARKKIYFVKNGKAYEVTNFDKNTGKLVLRGEYRKFETTLKKAVDSGYKLERK